MVRCTSGKHQVNVKSQSELDIGGCEACNDVSLTFLTFELQKCFSSKNWSEFNQEFISGLTLLLGSLKAYSYRAVPRYLFYITLDTIGTFRCKNTPSCFFIPCIYPCIPIFALLIPFCQYLSIKWYYQVRSTG